MVSRWDCPKKNGLAAFVMGDGKEVEDSGVEFRGGRRLACGCVPS